MTSLVLIWCINSLKGETHIETHVFNDQFGGFISEKQLEPQAFCGWMSFCLVSGILLFCNTWIVLAWLWSHQAAIQGSDACLFASGCCYFQHIKVDTHFVHWNWSAMKRFRPQWSPDPGMVGAWNYTGKGTAWKACSTCPGESNNSNFSSCVLSYYQQISTMSWMIVSQPTMSSVYMYLYIEIHVYIYIQRDIYIYIHTKGHIYIYAYDLQCYHNRIWDL